MEPRSIVHTTLQSTWGWDTQGFEVSIGHFHLIPAMLDRCRNTLNFDQILLVPLLNPTNGVL